MLHVYCRQCGAQLEVTQTVGDVRIYQTIQPHTCGPKKEWNVEIFKRGTKPQIPKETPKPQPKRRKSSAIPKGLQEALASRNAHNTLSPIPRSLEEEKELRSEDLNLKIPDFELEG